MASISTDYVVVGAGITGSIFARILADAGRHVHVVEIRERCGGLLQDEFHFSGIRIGCYGHYPLATDSLETWQFLQRFDWFHQVASSVRVELEGHLYPWPLTVEYLNRRFGLNWPLGHYGWSENFEQAMLKKLPTSVYQDFVLGYSRKQWGVEPTELSAELASRAEIGTEKNPARFHSAYQGVPKNGYSALIESMLEGILSPLRAC